MAFPLQFGSPTPVVITDGSGNSGTSANLPVIDASVGADNATAPVFATEVGWVDGTGKLQAVSAANPLPVSGAGGGGGSVTQGTVPWVVSNGGTFAVQAGVPALGQAVAGSSLPVVLPAAQITTLTPPAAITNFANETGGNLATIATRTPALGQALAAASVPVILPAATITTLTPPTSVTVTQGTPASLQATVTPAAASIFEVSPTTAANTNANPFFNSITDGTTKATVIAATAALKTDESSWAGTALGAPTNFGTTPGAVASPGVNASLFVGTNAITAAATGVPRVGISGTNAATMDAVVTAATAPANGLATLDVYSSTAPSLTTGQSVALQGDYTGSLFVKPIRRSSTVGKQTHIAASVAATTVVAAPAAGIFADISTLIMTVAPIATTAIDFTATLSDGTISYIYNMNTGVTASGTNNELVLQFNPPLPATTAATAWTITLSTTAVLLFDITSVAVLQKAS